MTSVGTKEGIDMFCLSLLGRPLAMMHLIDAVLDSFSKSISIPQVPPFREDLFCRSLHGRPQLEVEVHREAVTAIGETYKFIRAGGGKVILA